MKCKMKQTVCINREPAGCCGSTQGRIWEGFMKEATCAVLQRMYRISKQRERKRKALHTKEVTQAETSAHKIGGG